MIQDQDNTSVILPFLAVFVTLLAYLAALDAGYVASGSAFEYASDAPYVHLAAAEDAVGKGLTFSAMEPVLQSSSPLYTALLTPLTGKQMQRFLPLVLNALGLFAAAWIWGRLIWQAGFGDGPLGIFLATGGPVALGFVGFALFGLEHVLFLAISFAIFVAILRVLDGERISRGLLLLVVIAPLLQSEGILIALIAGVSVFLCKRYKGGLILLIFAIIPVQARMYWRSTQGFDPVPEFARAIQIFAQNSIADPSSQARWLSEILVTHPLAQLLATLIALGALLLLSRSVWRYRRWPLVFAMVVLGCLGFMIHRFDIPNPSTAVFVALVAAGIVAAIGSIPGGVFKGLALVPILFAAWINIPLLKSQAVDAPRAVMLRHEQLAQFAKEHLNAPVAVDRAGYLAWNNSNDVVSLQDLSNDKALMDQMIVAKDIRIAIISDDSTQFLIGANWTLLGQLKIAIPNAASTRLYLTGDHPKAPYIQMLNRWKATLPDGADFVFAETPAQ